MSHSFYRRSSQESFIHKKACTKIVHSISWIGQTCTWQRIVTRTVTFGMLWRSFWWRWNRLPMASIRAVAFGLTRFRPACIRTSSMRMSTMTTWSSVLSVILRISVFRGTRAATRRATTCSSNASNLRGLLTIQRAKPIRPPTISWAKCVVFRVNDHLTLNYSVASAIEARHVFVNIFFASRRRSGVSSLSSLVSRVWSCLRMKHWRRRIWRWRRGRMMIIW